MKYKNALIFLIVSIALGGSVYFLVAMRTSSDNPTEGSKSNEELKKSDVTKEPITISEDLPKKIITDSTVQEANEAKEWLMTTIDEFFDQKISNQNFRDITTERYAEYKQDAICVVYDCGNSLTEEQFEQKWSDFYDISYAGFGESFLTGQQDVGKIVMSKCALLSEPEKGKFIFDTVVEDTLFELTYSIEIVVKKTVNGFKIDDVKKRK